ncbi:hypothetical protein C7999DRAFT_35810 [Corynascus novoguineensis]|uniref:Uncharacterized protein n=1 Tax=Corynascus novoguineensis TaxID=1126955 RepID=A0AAN7CKQ3_9PEZI|nr:hypothetical protein C7999DRAFT_35810 [Corynascus novoguineensis]
MRTGSRPAKLRVRDTPSLLSQQPQSYNTEVFDNWACGVITAGLGDPGGTGAGLDVLGAPARRSSVRDPSCDGSLLSRRRSAAALVNMSELTNVELDALVTRQPHRYDTSQEQTWQRVHALLPRFTITCVAGSTRLDEGKLPYVAYWPVSSTLTMSVGTC